MRVQCDQACSWCGDRSAVSVPPLEISMFFCAAVASPVGCFSMAARDPETHYNLGSALVKKGKLDPAITQFREVLRLKPDFSSAQNDVDKVRAQVRQREDNK
jgi:tetratricopeptide (TPR) repeat protein